MKPSIILGQQAFPPHDTVRWCPAETISGHALIVGSSGTGKTYRLNRILEGIIETHPGAIIHVLDSQGDVMAHSQNRIRFSETDRNGLNPLVIHADPEMGGVRRRINSFIWMINTYSTRLGIHQESILRHLLEELYELNGYDMKDPMTWDPRTNPRVRGKSRMTKRHPGIQDLENLCLARIKQVLTGARGDAVQALEDLSKQVLRLHKTRIQNLKEDKENTIAVLKERALASYAMWLEKMETGTEVDDLLRYGDYTTMKSVLERIRSISAMGIFHDSPPEFSPQWQERIYDISTLHENEQRMFADILLEYLFLFARSKGIAHNPRIFIVIDEAHKFMRPEADHILNRISREARKFGIGLILASQSFQHFPEDLIANSAMTVILGLHALHHERAERKLGLPRKKLQFIRPQKTALIQLRHRGSGMSDSRFIDVNLQQYS